MQKTWNSGYCCQGPEAETEKKKSDALDNPLKNAPHTIAEVTGSEWNHHYAREEAAFPLPFVHENKFWPPVGRVNNSQGDRHLICTCPPVESYVEEATH